MDAATPQEEQQKRWRHNSPALYDMAVVHRLAWPSLTVQWLRGARLLLATFTSGAEPEHVLVARADVPRAAETGFVDAAAADDGAALDDTRWAQLRTDAAVVVEQRVPHEREANRARAMPQDEHTIATRGPTASGGGAVFVHRLCPPDAGKATTTATTTKLPGPCVDGTPLSWAPTAAGTLAGGDNDGHIAVWDAAAGALVHGVCQAAPRGVTVEDVRFHPGSDALLVSVDDAGALQVWDTRTAMAAPALRHAAAHGAGCEVNGVAVCAGSGVVLATAGADCCARVWDLRALADGRGAVRVLAGAHREQLLQAEWCPQRAGVLATASTDAAVVLWDVTAAADDDAVLFRHCGHAAAVTDLCWSPEEPWTVASVSEDNDLQLWRVAQHLRW